MQLDISKYCANSLLTFSKEEYDIKLKSTHAHELVAAFFGYKKKNSLLADTKYPVSSLNQAEIIVMLPDNFIDKRRSKLDGLSPELPSNDMLGDVVYHSLHHLCEDVWDCPYAPFRSYEKLAKVLVENNPAYQSVNRLSVNIPRHHYVTFKDEEDTLILTAFHAYEQSDGEMEADGKTIIQLPRVAGHIGFGKPKMYVEKWRAGFRRSVKSLGVKL